MILSASVVLVRPPDEKWTLMKKIRDACKEASVRLPEEVSEFFNWEEPDSAGVIIDISNEMSVYKFSRDGCWGYNVELSKLPKDVKFLRFLVSY